MNILIIGSGGREHTITWALSQSKKVENLYVAPGNAGTAQIAVNLDFGVNDFEKAGNFALQNSIDFVVVGPEEPLVKGIKDFFKKDENLRNIPVIGPDKTGAMLEGSKDFAKNFMQKYNIPTAAYFTVVKENLDEGINFLEKMKAPYVLKADGLAAGKGVLILNDLEEAKIELRSMLKGKFGIASSKVVIEQFLDGIELSVFIITDGEDYLVLPEAKDYKRIGENDTGLNTGGMGAVSPVPFADEVFMTKINSKIIKPTIEGLQSENIDYTGFIFFGLIKVDNEPYVIEYNTRMGDPETEVVFPRIKNDFGEIFEATAKKELANVRLEITDQHCATVVLVSGGYPGSYEKGKEITGLENVKDSLVFHAGTTMVNSKTVTSGGRVIALSSFGNSMKEALQKSYKSAQQIHFEGKHFRKDIGFDL